MAHNRVSLSASASTEVAQDWLTLTLSTTRDGADAGSVQAQLKVAVEAALNLVRPAAAREQMEVRSGNFSLYPRHGRDGKIVGWQGQAEVVLEGRDFARITTAAGQVQTLVLQGMQFGVSAQARQALEMELQAQAIQRFRNRAQQVAQAFGHKGYSLVQVNVGQVDGAGGGVRPRAMAMDVRAAAAEAPVPAEPGRAQVQLQVTGTVALH